MDRTRSKTDLPALLARIDRRRLSLTEHQWSGPAGLVEIALYLAAAPRDTLQLIAHFKRNRNELAERLCAGARFGLLVEKPNATSGGPGKIGRQPSTWALSIAGARSLAREGQPASPTSLLDSLPPRQREILDRWDFEAEGLSAGQAWRIAELAAVIRNTATMTLAEIDVKLGRNQRGAYSKRSVSLAELKGHIRVHRPDRKGALGRPSNDYTWLWETFAPRPGGARRQLAPARTPHQLGDLEPTNDRRSREQRAVCQAIPWSVTRLTKAQYWADAKVLFALIGTSRVATYADLAAERGVGVTAIEKTVRRLKAAKLIELKTPPGGRKNWDTEWCPNWSKLQTIVGEASPPTACEPAAASTAASPAAIEWSPVRPPSVWIKIFRVDAFITLRRRVTRGDLRGEQLTRKQWRFRMDDLTEEERGRLIDSN